MAPKRTLRLADLRDQWGYTLVGAALAVFAATNLKFLLIPSGLATLIWTFAAGVLVGAVSFIAVAVYLFSEAAHQDDLTLQMGPSALPFNPCEVPEGGEACIPPWAARGHMDGTVWTIAGSQWEDSDTLLGTFPPAHAGDKPICVKWHASIKAGVLHMFQDPSTTFKPDPPDVIPSEVSIPLSSVTVDLMLAATKGKSQWFRKAPMKLILADGVPRPYDEDTFVFFAMDSAAKEQWYLALVWGATSPDVTPPGLEAQRLYSLFCAHLRPVAPVPIPKMASARARARQPLIDASSQAQKDAGQRRWWGGRVTRKPARGTPRCAPAALHSARGLMPPPKQPPHVLEEMDKMMDFQWAGGQIRSTADKKAKHAKTRRGHVASMKSSPSFDSLTAARTPSAAVLAAAPDLAPPDLLAAPDPLEADGIPAADWPLEGAGAGSGLPEPLLIRNASVDSSHSAFPTPAGASPVGGGAPSSATFGPAAGSTPDLSAGHAPTQLAGLHAVNMFITRIAFDLLRSERFHASVRDRLMTRLANIHVPNYVTPLRLVGLDLGSTPPFVRTAHSLPSPGKTIWPRLVMHMVYHGKCTLTVETNVDFKDSAGFMNFDRAMEVFGGSDDEEAAVSDTDAERNGAAYTGSEGMYGSSVDEAQADTLASEVGASDDAGVQRLRGISPEKARKKGGLFSMKNMPFRKQIATGVRNVAGLIVEHVSKMPVRVDITLTELDGPVLVWLAPPPSTGLWVSFLEPPKMKLICRPVVSNRMIKYTAQAVSLSGWLESKIKSALQKNMVFPACSDISLKFLLSLADLGTPAVLPLVIAKQPSEADTWTTDDESERAARPAWAKSVADVAAEALAAARATDESVASVSNSGSRPAGGKPPRRLRKAASRDSLKSMSNPPLPNDPAPKRPSRPLWRRILRFGLPPAGHLQPPPLAIAGPPAARASSGGAQPAPGAAGSSAVIAQPELDSNSGAPVAQADRGCARTTDELRVDVDMLSDVSPALTRRGRDDESAAADDAVDDHQSWMYDESGVEAHTEDSEMGSPSPGFRNLMRNQSRSFSSPTNAHVGASPSHESAGCAQASPGVASFEEQALRQSNSDEELRQATLAAATAAALSTSNTRDVRTGSYRFLADGSLTHTQSPAAPGAAAASSLGRRTLETFQSITSLAPRSPPTACSVHAVGSTHLATVARDASAASRGLPKGRAGLQQASDLDARSGCSPRTAASAAAEAEQVGTRAAPIFGFHVAAAAATDGASSRWPEAGVAPAAASTPSHSQALPSGSAASTASEERRDDAASAPGAPGAAPGVGRLWDLAAEVSPFEASAMLIAQQGEQAGAPSVPFTADGATLQGDPHLSGLPTFSGDWASLTPAMAEDARASDAVHRALELPDADPLADDSACAVESDCAAQPSPQAAAETGVSRDVPATLELADRNVISSDASTSSASNVPQDSAVAQVAGTSSRAAASKHIAALSSLTAPFLSIDLSSKGVKGKVPPDTSEPDKEMLGSLRAELRDGYAASKAIAKKQINKLGTYADKWLGGLSQQKAGPKDV